MLYEKVQTVYSPKEKKKSGIRQVIRRCILFGVVLRGGADGVVQ